MVKLQLKKAHDHMKIIIFLLLLQFSKKFVIIITETFIYFITNTSSFDDTTKNNFLCKDQHNKSYKLCSSSSLFLLCYNKRTDDKLKITFGI